MRPRASCEIWDRYNVMVEGLRPFACRLESHEDTACSQLAGILNFWLLVFMANVICAAIEDSTG